MIFKFAKTLIIFNLLVFSHYVFVRKANGMVIKDNSQDGQLNQLHDSNQDLNSEDSHDSIYFDDPSLDTNSTNFVQTDNEQKEQLLDQNTEKNSTSKLYLQEQNLYDESLNETNSSNETIIEESSNSNNDLSSKNVEQEEVSLDFDKLFTEPFETETMTEQSTTEQTTSENSSSDPTENENKDEEEIVNTSEHSEAENEEVTVQNETKTEKKTEEVTETTSESVGEQTEENEAPTVTTPITSEETHVTEKHTEANTLETTHEMVESTEKQTSKASTSRKPIVIKPVVPAFIPVNRSSSMNAECPSLTCEFGFKVDLFNKPLCACYDPCEHKCQNKICKVKKLDNNLFISECYDPLKIERPVNCYLPVAKGTCANYTSRFYFNSFHQRCQHFIYTGCSGNDNNFPTWEKCQMECNTCTLPPEQGPCLGSITRYYYDTKTRECKEFKWSGCKGNENNFSTRKHCEDSCMFRKEGSLFLHGMPLKVIRKYNSQDSD